MSVLYIVILSANVLGQSFHKRPSEGLRRSLNQPTQESGGKTLPLLVAKSFLAFFSSAKGGGEAAERLWGATLPPAGHRNENGASPEENP